MKKKDLYKIVKQSLKEILKENKRRISVSRKKSPSLKPQLDPDKSTDLNLTTSCSTQTPYGSINVYGGSGTLTDGTVIEACTAQVITDAFICCSSNNPNSNMAGPVSSLMTAFGFDINPETQNGCFDESNIVGGQFTYAQFEEWYLNNASDGSTPLGIGGYGIVPIDDTDCIEEGAVGCPHPESLNYVEGSQGCVDDAGNLLEDGMDISCCQFTGCGASTSEPPALNLSGTVPATTLGDFTFDEILPSETESYWVDNGSCQFPQLCTQGTVNIDGIDYTTTTGLVFPDGNFPTTVQNSINYNTDISGGSCVIEACANEELNGLEDNLGNSVLTSYALAEGTYGPNSDQVVNQESLCTITACDDSNFDNYWGFWVSDSVTGDYTINNGGIIADNSLCLNDEVAGCNDETACNYDPLVTSPDGSCIYPDEGFDCDGEEIDILGCTNPLSNPFNENSPGVYNPNADVDDNSCIFNYCTIEEGNSNYVCDLYPDLCDGNLPDLTLGSFNNFGCTSNIYGCMDDTLSTAEGIAPGTYEATNYNPDATVPCGTNDATQCTGALPDSYAIANGLDNPIQTLAQNPQGCCCTYIPGCTKQDSINFNPSATIDDGSCIFPVYGCMNPGFDNYNPMANINQVSPDDSSNPCVYEGCMMEISPSIASNITTSPWENYVCLDDTIVINQQTQEAFTIGEWLCGCGANGGAPCSGTSNFILSLGTYIDSSAGYNSNTSEIDPLSSGYPYSFDNEGNCNTLIDLSGCNNNGSPFYLQNQGGGNVIEMELTNWIEDANEDGSCQYAACANPYALNYFCVDNPDLCTTDITLFAQGCETDPANYPDGLPTCLNSKFGVLNTPANFLQDTDGCEFAETYNCTPGQGCQDPGDGTGKYNTLNECEAECKLCTKAVVETCSGNFTKTFECLYIDGEMGDPNCNTPGLYCVGQEFEISEFSGFGPPLVSTGNVSPVDPKPNELYSMRNYRVVAISEPDLSSFDKDEGTSTTCPEIGNERDPILEPIRDPEWVDDVIGGDETTYTGGGWFCPADSGNFPWPTCCIQSGIVYDGVMNPALGGAFEEFYNAYSGYPTIPIGLPGAGGINGVTYFASPPGVQTYNNSISCNEQSNCDCNLNPFGTGNCAGFTDQYCGGDGFDFQDNNNDGIDNPGDDIIENTDKLNTLKNVIKNILKDQK